MLRLFFSYIKEKSEIQAKKLSDKKSWDKNKTQADDEIAVLPDLNIIKKINKCSAGVVTYSTQRSRDTKSRMF